MALEDFDFKPMTSGLGFDKQAEEVKHSIIETTIDRSKVEPRPVIDEESDFPNPTTVSRSLQKMLENLPPSVDFTDDNARADNFMPPKPQAPVVRARAATSYGIQEPAPQSPPPPVQPPSFRPKHSHGPQYDVTLNNSISNAFPKVEFQKSFFHQTVTPQPQYKEVPASFTSAIIDGLITLGITSLFTVSLVVIFQIDLVKLMASQKMVMRTALDILYLYFGIVLIYFMAARGLWGSTLGDWAFDIQLGSEKQRRHVMYPYQVLFRTFIILATGIILIPLVSMGFGKDMAEKFSGLKLYLRQF